VLFLAACVALTAYVLIPEIWGNGKTKDYPLWFRAGQQVLQGRPLYPNDPNGYFELIYLPAILLAVPSWFGKIPLYLVLSLLDATAWWITSQLSNAMAGSGRPRRPGGGAALSLPMFPLYLQAMGNNLAATIVLVAGLVWHIRRPPANDHVTNAVS